MTTTVGPQYLAEWLDPARLSSKWGMVVHAGGQALLPGEGIKFDERRGVFRSRSWPLG